VDSVRWIGYGGLRTVDSVRWIAYGGFGTVDCVRWIAYGGLRTVYTDEERLSVIWTLSIAAIAYQLDRASGGAF